MYREFSVPVSYAGGISMIIAVGTIVSSLLSDRLTKRFGAGKITAVSVFMTAAALFGFSTSHTFIALCLWAVPYGLGAGCVDAALNNYVALHYTSRHMSWLHCMWGVGASLGPYIMGYALSNGHSWNMGYRYISILQILLTAVLLFSLPLWKKPTVPAKSSHTAASSHEQALSLSQIVRISRCKRNHDHVFSVTVLWNRQPDFGAAAIWFYTGGLLLKLPPDLPACFSLESLREGHSADF